MPDIVDSATRSRMMSSIRGKDTKPELRLRSLLWRAGFRFRLHARHVPGRPDLVLPKWRAVVFVHGCFWHGHSGCRYFRVPDTRPEFWRTKFSDNKARDLRVTEQLIAAGWRVFVVWECAMRANELKTASALEALIRSGSGPAYELREDLASGRTAILSVHL